jgi:Ca2+-binding RTX toxin-like protein
VSAASPRQQRKYSKREPIRIFLREILSTTWQPLWRISRRFDKAWYALVLSGALAFGQMSHTATTRALNPGVDATYASGTLNIQGTAGDDQVVVTVDASGNVLVNGLDPRTGPVAGVNVGFITVETFAGADTVDLSALSPTDLANGAQALVLLGDDDDTLALSPEVPTNAIGGAGSDTIQITADGEILYADSFAVVNSTSHTFNGVFEQALLSGGTGNDTLDASGFSGSVTLRGLGGDDTLIGAGGDDTLDGGDGIDTVVQQADGTQTLTDTQLSGRGTDTLISIERADLIGGEGDDTLDAANFSGDVRLRGLAGNDILIGSKGDSVIEGGEGDDTITSGKGKNTIDGGPGINTIDGVVQGGSEEFIIHIPLLRS